MAPKKQGSAKDNRTGFQKEKGNHWESDVARVWESFIDYTTKFLQGFLEILVIFWMWLHSWGTVLFDSSEQEVLIQWLKTQMPEVPSDFSESWKDGILLCTLLENLNPGCSPRPDLLDPDQGCRNVSRALEIIKRFDISPGIKAEDIVFCSADSEKRLIALLYKIKKKTESFHNKGVNDKGDSLHVRRPPPEVQACFAKGTGLAVGFLRRPARFAIFCESVYDLDIVIEIKGPGNIACCERITARSPKRKKSHSQPLYDLKLIKPMRSISVTDDMIQEQIKTNSNPEKLRLGYEVLDDRISVDYIPMITGDYRVTILWHGQHIPDSPFHVSVEDTLEKSNVSNVIHLRPSLRHKDCLNPTEDGGMQAPKTRKHSVRFKDSEIENKEWGKVTKRKVLRYIVKLNGKEVEVDVDRSDMLGPALLKLDYELENKPTCHRRNSWGFVGDVERKKSMVRQFCVDLEEKEICGMQRRSSSFHLSLSSDSQRAISKEDENPNTKSSNLKTVSEGTDKDFTYGDQIEKQTNDYYESFSDMEKILVGENLSTSHGTEMDAKEKEPIYESSFETSVPCELKVQEVDEATIAQAKNLIGNLKHNTVSSAYVDQNGFECFVPNMNANQKIKINKSNIPVIEPHVNLKNNVRVSSFNQGDLEYLSSARSNLLTKNFITSKKKLSNKNSSLNRKRLSFQYTHRQAKASGFKFFSNGYPLRTRCRKHLVPKRVEGNDIKKIPQRAPRKAGKRTPEIKYKCKILGMKKTTCQNKLKNNNNDKNGFTMQTQKYKNIPCKIRSQNKSPNMTSSLYIKPWNSEASSKSPYILQNVMKGKSFEDSTTSEDGMYSKMHTFNKHNTTKKLRMIRTLPKSKYFDDPNLNHSVASNLLNHSEQPSFNDHTLPNFSSIKSYMEDSQKSDSLTDKSDLVDEYQNSYKDYSKASDRSDVPAVTFQYFKHRGKSFSRLSLGQSVKDIVKDFENSSLCHQDDITTGKNFYSNSLNFPPLAVNEDRIRVRNRIMQWETTSSLPSGVCRNIDSYKNQDRAKLSVLSDVHSKTAFWETAYTIKQDGYMGKNSQTCIYKKPHNISKSDTGIYTVTTSKSKTQTKKSDKDRLQQRSAEFCSQEADVRCLKPKRKKFQYKNYLKNDSAHFKERRASDPGPAIKGSNSKSQLTSKFSISNDNFYAMGSLWSLGTLSSSATFSYLGEKDSGDEYIDDEIPDYAAMFWDDYISNAGLLFDGRRNCFRPNADEVKVYGAGVYYGHVSVKNYFQVLTKGAGRGHLSVSVQGSSLHDVTNINVVYSKRDIYTVTYQVIEPGYYLISVRWSDVAVPGSPFVCKITY